MSDTHSRSNSLLTDAHNNINQARAYPPYDSATVLLQAAQVQATMAHALEVRHLRELLEDRLPDKWSHYGQDL